MLNKYITKQKTLRNFGQVFKFLNLVNKLRQKHTWKSFTTWNKCFFHFLAVCYFKFYVQIVYHILIKCVFFYANYSQWMFMIEQQKFLDKYWPKSLLFIWHYYVLLLRSSQDRHTWINNVELFHNFFLDYSHSLCNSLLPMSYL